MKPLLEMMAALVAEGANVLDAHLPGWAARVDPNRLDAASDRDSVLGQPRDQPVSVSGLCALLVVDQTANGFALNPDTAGRDHSDTEHAEPETPTGAPELTAAWHAEITRRTSSTLTVVDAEGVG